jgi:nucleotide-binding universal stress UspA family protein
VLGSLTLLLWPGLAEFSLNTNFGEIDRVIYKKILVPLDGSPLAEVAARHAANVSRLSHGELIFLRVATTETAKEAADYLDDVNEEAYFDGLEAKSIVGSGPPAQRIVETAGELGVDLIVLSSHGRTGLARQVFGSVAEEVMRAATCPVTVVKAFQRHDESMRCERAS